MPEPIINVRDLIDTYRDDPQMTHAKWVQWAVACAERVAHHNPDPRVRAALDAARAWLTNPTQETAAHAANAAYAAHAARAAADAAALAAANAAYAAANAAYAAAYAALAAANAAYAADAAALAAANAAALAAAYAKEEQWQVIRLMEIYHD